MTPANQRPPRDELFGFYYLGFDPAGSYRFPNSYHVAAYYKVHNHTVLDWLEEMNLSPRYVLYQQFDVARASVDLQMDVRNLTPEGIKLRIREALAALDAAPGGRNPNEGD